MMTKTLKDLLEHAETWPREDQDELAEYAREIQARRTGVYTMSEDERAAVAKLLAPVAPAQILCSRLNYRRHAEETKAGSAWATP